MNSWPGDESDRLLRTIRVLSELAWDGECQAQIVNLWLKNFIGKSTVPQETERFHALHLLSNFLYFGHREVRELLRSLYRDIFQYSIVEGIRLKHNDTLDGSLVRRLFNSELAATRFVPLGNPSESSSHLLYYFRQVNEIAKERFANVHDILSDPNAEERIVRCIFIDDFAGTGQQAMQDGRHGALQLKEHARCKVCYYVLVATDEALATIRDGQVFDEVRSVLELSSEYRTFAENSLFYEGAENLNVSRETMQEIARTYGRMLEAGDPMGFQNSELVLGFAHNVPDNTLPIFRSHDPHWNAPFPRYPKWSVRDD